MTLTLLVLALAAAPPAQLPNEFSAPPNRWFTHGGSYTRSGASRGEALRGPVTEAWTHEAGGSIEGEPLVWDDTVVLCVNEERGPRRLRMIDLLTGEPLYADRRVSSEVTLEPTVWRNRVAYRSKENQITVARIGQRTLSEVWKHKTEGAVGAPLMVGSRVYVCTSTALECLAVGKRVPSWRVPGEFRGRVAIEGDTLHAVSYDENGQAFLAGYDVDTGKQRGPKRLVGRHAAARAEAPGMESMVTVTRHPEISFVEFEKELWFGELRASVLGIQDDAKDGEILSGSADMLAMPAPCKGGWLAPLFMGTERALVFEPDVSDRAVQPMARDKENPEWVLEGVAPTILGDVAYVGKGAVDMSTGLVLWRLHGQATSRAVPARESVLCVEDDTRLVAIRQSLGSAAVEVHSKLTEGELSEGRVVLRDGSIEVDDWTVALERRMLTREVRKKIEEIALDDVLLVESKEGELLFSRGPDELVRALTLLSDSSLADEYTRLAKSARKSLDPSLVREFVQLALENGGDVKDLADLEEAAASIEKKGRKPKAERIAKLKEEALALENARVDTYWSYAEARGLDESRELALLRATLEEDSGHPAAKARVLALIPEEVRPETLEYPLDWLDFVEATRITELSVYTEPGKERDDMPWGARMLGRVRAKWRKDLVAFESENLLILTPVKQPGAIARCISMGELVCDALESMFAEGDHERDDRYPLLLYLYETKEEYLEQSGDKGDGEAGNGLAWTAGHYNVHENISRIYIPDGEEEMESVLKTYAHELTHHWLRRLCPAIDPEATFHPKAPGFWIVEGFASLVEEFSFDLRSRTWQVENPQSLRLDRVANAKKGQYLPWKGFFHGSQVGFWKLSIEPGPQLPSRCRLGVVFPVSRRSMFYAQAAAASRFFFQAEGGKYRPMLLEFLRAYYESDQEALDFEKIFGLDRKEAGELIMAFARAEMGME